MLTLFSNFHNTYVATRLYEVMSDTDILIPNNIKKKLCQQHGCRCSMKVTKSKDPNVLVGATVHCEPRKFSY